MSEPTEDLPRYSKSFNIPKMSVGTRYIIENGCVDCGCDVEATYGVAVMCVNWQHPTEPTVYREGGLRNCSFILTAAD